MDTFDNLWASLVNNLPEILAALAVIVVGLLVAWLISALVRRLLERTSIDERIARAIKGGGSPAPENIRIVNWTAGIVFWVVLFIAIVAALQILNLNAVAGPLNNLLTPVLAFIPNLLSALILVVIAWLIATVLRAVVTRVISASGLARSATEQAEIQPRNRTTIATTLGNVVYWLVFLLFLPAILGALQLNGILGPVQGMVDGLLAYLPNILGAAVILIVGYFVARVIRQIVTNLLNSAGLDNIGRRAGMGQAADRVSLSSVIGWTVYVLILIPVIIAALNALNIPAVSTPASNMLNAILTALPNIFAAVVVLVLAYFIGRLLGRFIATLLSGIGFNRFFSSIGFYRPGTSAEVTQATRQAAVETTGTAPAETPRTTPADIVGYLVTVAVILFASMQAANLLGFVFLATLLSEFIAAAFQVLVGLGIFAIGLYLSSLAARAIRDSNMSQANILAPVARVAIIVFAGALALRQMGIADSIVNLAFGLMLGAVAVAAALAFGLGGRDAARQALERWQDQVNVMQMIPNTGNEQQERKTDDTGSTYTEPTKPYDDYSATPPTRQEPPYINPMDEEGPIDPMDEV